VCLSLFIQQIPDERLIFKELISFSNVVASRAIFPTTLAHARSAGEQSPG
jgi:hypothetical protein